MDKCVLCGETDMSPYLHQIFDTRFGVNGLYDFYKCNECNLIQINPLPGPRELKNLYEVHYNYGGSANGIYEKFRNYFSSSWLYRAWMFIDGDICFHLKHGKGRLLDVGCNEGKGLDIYKKNGYIAEGLELNERAAATARKKGFEVYTKPVQDMNLNNTYEVVVLSHVLEHSLNPLEMLESLVRIIKPGGELWISTPNIESWQARIFGKKWVNWHVPFHISLFSASTLNSLLKKVSLDIDYINNVSPALWSSQSIIAWMFGKQGKINLSQKSTVMLAMLMLVVRFLCFPILWIGNKLNRGDCIVVVARKRLSNNKQE